MPSTPRSLLALAAAGAALAAGPAAAGPCVDCSSMPGFPLGWWDDRPLSPAGGRAVEPRVDVDTDFGGDPYAAVVWAESAAGPGDIWFGSSDDQGCSFSLTPLTAGPEDDRLPDVAMAIALGQTTVVFVRDGRVHATHSADGGLSFSAPELLHATAAVDPASPPRLAGVRLDLTFHVHLVWGDGAAVYYARSTAGGAPGTWLVEPAPLTDRFVDFGEWAAVDAAADTRSFDPATTSSVTLTGAARAAGRSVWEVVTVRSIDGGASFFGDPVDPATADLPRPVSDPRPDDPAANAIAPSIDGSDDGTGAFFVWTPVTWTEPGALGLGAAIDARAEEGATPSVIADWNRPPAPGDLAVGVPAHVAAGVSVVPNPLARPPTPDLHTFVEDPTGGVREIAAVRGLLDQNAAPTVVLNCTPYQLTGVTPARVTGEVVAGSLSVDEDLVHVWAVWADTRDGSERIYFKRSDTFTRPANPVTVTPVPCASGGGLEVTWTPPTVLPHCDIDTFRVEWGRAPRIYDGAVDLPPGASSTTLTGLDEATLYYVAVTTIDEACNAWPSNETQATTEDCSGPRCPNPVGNTVQGWKAAADVELVWQAPPVDANHDAATGYDVYRSTVRPQDGYSLLAAVPGLAATDAGAVPPSPSPLHFYRLVARNACGTSGDEPPP